MSANPIGAWYDDKAREAAELSEQLRLAKLAGATAEEIRRLERLLEMARYTGD